jgi:hypothetical protein
MNRPGNSRRPAVRILRTAAAAAAVCAACLIAAVQWDFARIGRMYRSERENASPVRLRRFPYPFRAALSICSDIDNTETAEEFLAIQEFLNTDHVTPFGKGAALEIGNSFYPYDRPDRNEFSWYSGRALDRDVIRRFARSGYIDCIHSFGEGCTTRAQALRAIRTLEREGCRFPLWVNHSDAATNMGKWFSTNRGDRVGDPVYHADATIPYGIRYVNCGSSTSIIGQDAPVSWRTYFCLHGQGSCMKVLRNNAKAFLKRMLSQFGISKNRYFLHRDNALLGIRRLEDGRRVYEFMRYDIDADGIGYGATSRGLAANISEPVLQRLLETGGTGIVYTHLGKNACEPAWIGLRTAAALSNLAGHYRNGDILVTTTSRLLNYVTVRRALRWTATENADSVVIRIACVRDPILGEIPADPIHLQGITFTVPSSRKVRILVGGSKWTDFKLNPPDESGNPSVSFPWIPLRPPEFGTARP